MSAMDRETGREIAGIEEIEQSIDTILATTPGDRVMRADYGSDLFALIDNAGLDQSGKMRLTQATEEAIRRHERRVRIVRVDHEASPGTIVQTIYGRVSTGQQVIVRREAT